MKHRYYAAFIPGTQDIVAELLRRRLADVTLLKLLDGAVVFETDCTYDRLNFFCFNNIFAVLDIVETNSARAVESHIERILKRHNVLAFDSNTKNIRTFRVITSHENHLIPIREELRAGIERFIAGAVQLTINRSKPDTEYWFLYRNEGFSVFMKRLTRHKTNEKALHRGELPPQLAYMMSYLAHPQSADTVIDPFCGYGSIPAQILKHFPVQTLYMFDRKKDALDRAKNNISGRLAHLCHIKQLDIYDIASVLPENSIDKIITDPPWGMYEQFHDDNGGNCVQFYIDIISIFNKLLKPGGVIVLLTASTEELLHAVSLNKELSIENTIRILVSGKKAGLFYITSLNTPKPKVD
jgi:tRNA G10  N-methylase Trm11